MFTYSRALIALIFFVSASLVGATGVPEAPADDQLTNIRLTALSGPTGVGVADLVNAGTVNVGSARVSTDLVAEPPLMVARLASGETDIGMLPSNVVAQLASRGVPVQVAAVSLWGVLFIVSRDDAIQDWDDLRGRTFYSLAQGANPDVVARHLMTRNGVDPDSDVDMRYGFGHAELAQLLIAGEIDTAVLPEPLVTQVLSRSPDLRIAFDMQEGWRELYGSRYPQTAIVVRSDVAARSPQAVEDVLQLMVREWDEALADPQAAGEAAEAAGLGLPAAVVASAISRFNVDFQFADEARAELDRYFAILFEADPRNVGGAVPGDEVYWSN